MYLSWWRRRSRFFLFFFTFVGEELSHEPYKRRLHFRELEVVLVLEYLACDYLERLQPDLFGL